MRPQWTVMLSSIHFTQLCFKTPRQDSFYRSRRFHAGRTLRLLFFLSSFFFFSSRPSVALELLAALCTPTRILITVWVTSCELLRNGGDGTNWNQIPKHQPAPNAIKLPRIMTAGVPNDCGLTVLDCSPRAAHCDRRRPPPTASGWKWKGADGPESIQRLMAPKAQTGWLTLYQTISRSRPSVLKLHLRVTVSPTTTGGRGSMVTVKYPGRQRRGWDEFDGR